LVVLAVIAALSGCSGDDETSMVGSVTTVRPVLCIGRHDATGTCVDGASAHQLAGLAVGDCVRAVLGPADARGRNELRRLTAVSARAHRLDCVPPRVAP
jgi:hypothetical protein